VDAISVAALIALGDRKNWATCIRKHEDHHPIGTSGNGSRNDSRVNRKPGHLCRLQSNYLAAFYLIAVRSFTAR
jgi:hypothetical protein